MNNMDRYEKALELARSYYDKDANTFLDTIFPELKESEEDEKHRQWILECLADGKRKVPEFAEQYQAAFDWFKSLRTSWKPSEEQMEALGRCVEYLEESDNEDTDILAVLYNQLKKLM